jgi:hypothetical protein
VRVFESPVALKRYRRTRWAFQQTFLTPLDDLARFVDVILSALPGIEGAVVAFDHVVFEPRYELVALYERYGLPPKWRGGRLGVEARGAAEAGELLRSVLSEWIDFVFVPTPERFVVYADHDEYITFLARGKGGSSEVVEALTAAGFRAVDYVRKR